MPTSKDANPKDTNLAGASALVGKTITGVIYWRHGIVDVMEINYAGGPLLIKFRQGQCDVGGTADFGTGTLFG